jgi:hypothetical protein
MTFRTSYLALLSLFLLGGALPGVDRASAQTIDVRGVVIDSTTGEKIPFASVLILNTTKGASTNLAGFYLIPNIPTGTYDVSASSIGYHRKTKTITIRRGEAIQVNFDLVEEAVEMSEVIITERAKRELKEIQTSVQVMDQRDLKLVPTTVQADVFRSIQILPGIVSTSDVSSQFYVRGGAGDQNLILIDGMRIYNPYHALGIFSIFDSDIIQTSEIYTGAFPPGFGGRLSSVVNLISRDGRKTSFAARANVNFLSSKIQAEGPIGENIRFFTNARKSFSSNTFSKFLNQDAPLSFYDMFTKVTMEGNGGTARYSGVAFLSGDDIRFGTESEADYSWSNKAIGVTGSGLLDERIFVSAVAYGSAFQATREAHESAQTPAASSVKDFTVRTNATLYTDSKTLYFFGFEFNFPSLEYSLVNNAGNEVVLKETLADVSAWFRTQVSGDIWQFDGGVHLDMTTLFRGNSSYWFQPRLNMSMGMFHDWRVKLSYGRFTQYVITVNNEDDLISLFDAWIAVPEDLEPQRSDHYVLGVGGSLMALLGLDIQGYYKDFSSLITYNRDKLVASDPDYINGSGRAYGAEVMLRYEHPLVDLLSTYALSWTKLRTGSFEYAPRYDRRHSLKLLGVVRPIRNLDVSIRWDYGSGLPYTPSVASYNRLPFTDVYRNPTLYETGSKYLALSEDKNSYRLPMYHRMDVALTYRIHLGRFSFGLGASITNVYDRKNIFYFDRQTGNRVNSLSFFPSGMVTIEYQ